MDRRLGQDVLFFRELYEEEGHLEKAISWFYQVKHRPSVPMMSQ